jgi:hypothetical protein
MHAVMQVRNAYSSASKKRSVGLKAFPQNTGPSDLAMQSTQVLNEWSALE